MQQAVSARGASNYSVAQVGRWVGDILTLRCVCFCLSAAREMTSARLRATSSTCWRLQRPCGEGTGGEGERERSVRDTVTDRQRAVLFQSVKRSCMARVSMQPSCRWTKITDGVTD